MTVSRPTGPTAHHPISDLVQHRPASGRAWPRSSAGRAPWRSSPSRSGPRKPAIGELLAARHQEQPLDAEFLVRRRWSSLTHSGLSTHSRTRAAMADPAHPQLRRRHRDLLVGGGGAVIERGTPNRPAARRGRKSRTPARRPISKKTMPATKLTPPNTHHQDEKAARASERCGVIIAEKIVGSRSVGVVGRSWRSVYRNHGEKIEPKASARHRASKGAQAKARKGKAAR